MDLNRTRGTGTRFAAALLSATIATAGLGLVGTSPLWADEGEVDQAPVEAPQQPTLDAYVVTTASAEGAPAAAAAETVTVNHGVVAKPVEAGALLDAMNAAREANGLGWLANDPALAAAAYQRANEAVLLGADVRPDGNAFSTVDGRAATEAIVIGAYGNVADANAVAAAIDGVALRGDLASAGVAAVVDGETLYYVVLAATAYDETAAASDFSINQDDWYSANISIAADALEVWSPEAVGYINVDEPAAVAVDGQATGALDIAGAQYGLSNSDVSVWRNAFTWSSSDDAIATVDDDGIVTAHANGDVAIYAQGPAGLEATFNYSASGAVEPIDLADATVAGIIDQNIISDYVTEQTPPFTVITPDNTTIDPSQYTYYFLNNIDPGEATLVVDAAEGSTEVTGELVKTFEIQAPASTVVEVPDLANRDEGDARGVLSADGIVNVQFVTGDPAPSAEYTGLVESTSPAAGEQIDTATQTLEVALYAEPAAEEQDEPADEAPSDEQTDEGDQQQDGDGQQDEGEEVTPAEDETPEDAQQDEGKDSSDQSDATVAQLVVAPIPDQVYTGAAIEPAVSATIDGNAADLSAIDVSYANNVDVGTASVTLTPREGSTYAGVPAITAQFEIVAASTVDISSYTVRFKVDGAATKIINPNEAATWEKDQIAVESGGTVLAPEDFEIVGYENNATPGTATIHVRGVAENGYSGETTGTFAVKGLIGQSMVSLAQSQTANLFYTGSPITPVPSVSFVNALNQGTDFSLAYTNNVNAGTASVTVTGTGNYTGEAVVNFTIQPKSIKSAQVSPISAYEYTGAPIEPAISVVDGTAALQAGIDYDVAYSSNTNAGTAHVTVTGKGNYRDGIDATFVINKLEMRKVTVVMPNMVYTGSALTPKPVSVTLGGAAATSANTAVVTLRPTLAYADAASSIQLVEGVDYDIVNYSNNTQVGEAKVELRGKGNFTGTKVASFKVVNPGSNDPGTTQTLPATYDDTNLPLLIGGIVGGVALIGVGAGLVVHSRRKNGK